MPYIQIHFLMEGKDIQISLSKDESDSIRNNIDYLQMTMSEIDYCIMLRENLVDAVQNFSANGVGVKNGFNQLNRHLMNWLNSFYAWVEFHEKNYHDIFSEMKRKYYDSYFEYRFAYEMRKYTTHQSVCISRMVFNVLKEQTRFEIPIDEILQHGKILNKRFKTELEALNIGQSNIELVEFTRGFSLMFERLQREIWDEIIPVADSCANSLQQYLRVYSGKYVTVFRMKDSEDKDINIGNSITRYFEKKSMLDIPEEIKVLF